MNVHASQFFVGSRSGLTRGQLRAGLAAGAWASTGNDTFRHGRWPATPLDRSLGVAIATDGVVSGSLAALLDRYDAGGAPVVDITVDRTASTERRGLRHRLLAPERIIEVAGFRCTDGLQTLIDLAWPELGIFIELDGQHHEDQPVYDASRETAIVAAACQRPTRAGI